MPADAPPARPALPPVHVTDEMIAAGAAALAAGEDMSVEDLVTAIYRAMVDAIPPVPVYGTSPRA